jgi:hypothetical protein
MIHYARVKIFLISRRVAMNVIAHLHANPSSRPATLPILKQFIKAGTNQVYVLGPIRYFANPPMGRQSKSDIVPVKGHSYIVAVYFIASLPLPTSNYNIQHLFILAIISPFVLSLYSEPGSAGLTIVIPASHGTSHLVDLIYPTAMSSSMSSSDLLVVAVPPLLDWPS